MLVWEGKKEITNFLFNVLNMWGPSGYVDFKFKRCQER